MTATDNCQGVIIPHYVIASILALDFMAIVLNTYFFTQPLFVLYRDTKALPATVIIDDLSYLKRIAVKQWILSFIAVMTTLLTIVSNVFTNLPEIFATFDMLISTLSIICMYEWNSWITDCECLRDESEVESKIAVEMLGKIIDGNISAQPTPTPVHIDGTDVSEIKDDEDQLPAMLNNISSEGPPFADINPPPTSPPSERGSIKHVLQNSFIY